MNHITVIEKIKDGWLNHIYPELYDNYWCIRTGRSIIYPHPHRHYTLIEFAFWLGEKEDLYDRFMTDKKSNSEISLTESMEDWFLEKFKDNWEVIETDFDFSQYEPIESSSSLHIIQDTYIIDGKKYRVSYPISDSSSKVFVEILTTFSF